MLRLKAVMDSKQVALLVPTTVLAQQHYMTVRDRMEPFGIRLKPSAALQARKNRSVY